MSAHAEVIDFDEQHPAVLLVRAHDLEREADELWKKVKTMRGEAAALRARADRYRDGLVEARPKREKRERPDSLLAAAGVAAEGLTGTYTAEEFAEALGIRDKARAAKLLCALERSDLIARVGEEGWRTQDPEEARVRDAARELGTFSEQQLAEHLEMTAAQLAPYVELGVSRGWISVGQDGHMMYLRPGPERLITRYPKRRPPEKEPPAGLDAPARGEPIRVVHHGKRGGAMSNPGVRHRIKQRDQRREAMENAKRERAEKQSARDRARNAAGGKRTK